ncbi:hypothetical protein LP420_38820 [Massilia sp. B-10]|nr:hypothetical protein LP420_38820 [Massilia sp. B-10]UUZ54185.1 hypothetical protein LP419_38290 [Massilia sp. H-1]
MSGAPIPAELQRFVLLAIPSVPYLEALLMLRADPARAWDAALVAKRLYLSEPSAKRAAGRTGPGPDGPRRPRTAWPVPVSRGLARGGGAGRAAGHPVSAQPDRHQQPHPFQKQQEGTAVRGRLHPTKGHLTWRLPFIRCAH